MAASVAQYAAVANWYSTASPITVPGLGWANGDVIVVGGGNSGNFTMGVPTNANLTFTQVQGFPGQAGDSACYLWKAKAASAQSGQTISCVPGGTVEAGMGVWVCTGANDVGVSGGNQHTGITGLSLNVAAGSLVCMFLSDWQTGNNPVTGTTGSGTHTERRDDDDGATWGQWAGDWVGTAAGTFVFGILDADYVGMFPSQAAVEVTAGVASVGVVLPGRTRKHRGLYFRSSGRHLSRSS